MKKACLGLGEPVVDDIHETVCLHRIPHNRGELNAALRSARLRDINYGKVRPVDCRSVSITKPTESTKNGLYSLVSSVTGAGS